MVTNNMTYVVYKKDGIYTAVATIGCGNRAYGTHLVVLENSPLTVVTNRYFERFHYKGEILEEQVFSIHRIPIKVQKVFVDRFILGDLDLGSKAIWHTVDIDIDTNILGRDILSQLDYEYKNDCLFLNKHD